MKPKMFRIPDELATQIEKDAREKKFGSENEWGIEAFQHYLSCTKLETTGAMKLIVLKFKDKCLKCTREVEAGEWGLWGRGVGVICIDCYVERLGDKTLIAKFLKNRELSRTRKVLEAECDRLATQVETHRLDNKIERIHNYASDSHKRIIEYFKEKIGTPEEKEALEEILKVSRKQLEIDVEIENFLQSTLKVQKWKKKAKQEIA